MDNLFVVDTDFLFALFVENDTNHLRSHNIMKRIGDVEMYTSNLVILELMTVFSNKVGQAQAKQVLANILDLPLQIKIVDQDYQNEIMQEFLIHDKNRISTVDCSVKILALKLKSKILSFDKFYPKSILLSES